MPDLELSVSETDRNYKTISKLKDALPQETFNSLAVKVLKFDVQKDEGGRFLGCRIYPSKGLIDLGQINRPKGAKIVGGLDVYTLKDGPDVLLFTYRDEAYYVYDRNPNREE